MKLILAPLSLFVFVLCDAFRRFSLFIYTNSFYVTSRNVSCDVFYEVRMFHIWSYSSGPFLDFLSRSRLVSVQGWYDDCILLI